MQKYRLAQYKLFSLNIYYFRQITPQNKIYIYIYIYIYKNYEYKKIGYYKNIF